MFVVTMAKTGVCLLHRGRRHIGAMAGPTSLFWGAFQVPRCPAEAPLVKPTRALPLAFPTVTGRAAPCLDLQLRGELDNTSVARQFFPFSTVPGQICLITTASPIIMPLVAEALWYTRPVLESNYVNNDIILDRGKTKASACKGKASRNRH